MKKLEPLTFKAFKAAFKDAPEGVRVTLADLIDSMAIRAPLPLIFLYKIEDDIPGSPTIGQTLYVCVTRDDALTTGLGVQVWEGDVPAIVENATLLIRVTRSTAHKVMIGQRRGGMDPVFAAMSGQAKVTASSVGVYISIMRRPRWVRSFFEAVGDLLYLPAYQVHI